MLAKKTSKNQITLPKKLLEKLPKSDYFDIKVRGDEVVLRPVKMAPAGSTLKDVRAKMRSLGITEKDIEEAVKWARERKR